jgi:iron complex transport system substrate-binding protein
MTVAVGVVGCAPSASQPSPPNPATAGHGTFPRTVEHAMGKTTISQAPQRVVALDATFVDAALTLDTPIVGYTNYPNSGAALPSYLGDAAATYAKGAKSLGTRDNPSLEELAAVQPDLIVSAKIRHEQIYDKLGEIAPTVFSQTTGATWKDNIRLLAKALGKEDLAERKLSAYQQRAKKIGDEIRAKEGKNPTVSVVVFMSGPTRLYKEDTYPGVVLADTGLGRPRSEQGIGFATEISEERIPDADADHIFVAADKDTNGGSQKTQQRFQANPLWNKLTGQKHEVDDGIWINAVGLQGANIILDNLAATFGVDPAKNG